MPTKAEIKRLSKPIKLKVRKGDQVVIITGKDKGQIGYVYAVSPKEGKVLVLKQSEENADQLMPLNAAIKHRKARTQGERSARVQIPVPIQISNVMVIDPATGQASRLGRRKDDAGKTVRYSKKSGNVIPNQPMDWGQA